MDMQLWAYQLQLEEQEFEELKEYEILSEMVEARNGD